MESPDRYQNAPEAVVQKPIIPVKEENSVDLEDPYAT
jgi:hypothetical protein